MSLFDSGVFISYDIEPFLPTILTHNTSTSAYPASRSTAYLPLNLYYAWILEIADNSFLDAIQQSAAQITSVALAEGQNGVDTAPIYPNYAIYSTPLERVYGDNLARLQSIKAAVDPNNVMGLAGGWKIQPS